MPQEIERKWLVDGDGWRAGSRGSGSEIVQGYLHVDDTVEIRVRVRDDDAVLTVKRGGRDQTRHEVEVAVGSDEARRLLERGTVGSHVRKRRHLVDLPPSADGPDLTAEVDEFLGDHTGLVLAEVELPDADAAVPEVDWFGAEVTGDDRYYNATLALQGLPD